MYLLPIHVPMYVDNGRVLLASDWSKSLELLRDSLEGRYGALAVASPTLPAAEAGEALVEAPDAVELYPGFDLRCRARQYWLQHRPGWRRHLLSLVAQAEVVHGNMDDVFRPISFEGFHAAIRLGKPALFVADTDIVIQQRQMAAHKGLLPRAKANTAAKLFERFSRWGVSQAALSLLKGTALMQRYGRYALNAREFHDTSFSLRDIVEKEVLERRLASLNSGRPLRLVYSGRLVPRKGVDRSLQIIAAAHARGCAIEFDIVGDGPELERLQGMALAAGIDKSVRFLGSQRYGSALLSRLSEYDALLFTPTAEDTPRMIFDGYAAGLPLIGFDIGYVAERAQQEQATILLPQSDTVRCAGILQELSDNRGRLQALAPKAREAAFAHCSESWYRRRAEWTFEAVTQYQRKSASGAKTTHVN